MKFQLLRNLLLLTVFLVWGNTSFSQTTETEKTEKPTKVKKVKKPKASPLVDENGNIIGAPADDLEGAVLYDFNMAKNPATGKIPEGVRVAALEQAKEVLRQQRGGNNQSNLGSYSFQGPDNLGGRTRTVAYDVRFNGGSNQIILAGGVSGGVYKSIDNGATWVRKSSTGDHFSCTSIAQDPRVGFQDTWYYGVGEASGNSAGAVGAFYLGNGVYKSTDNGETWARLTASNTSALETFSTGADAIQKVVVDPTTGNIYVACLAKIMRSTDGGTTWGDVLTGTLGSTTHVTDIIVTSVGRFYASFSGTNTVAVDGVWTSTTGASGSWTKIAGTGSATTPAGWNANAAYGRVVLAFAPSDPDKVYALYWKGTTSSCGGPSPEAELFRWTQAGGSWTDLSATLPDEAGCLEGNDPFAVQGGYDLVIAVKPDDATTLFIGGTNAYRSTTSGASWTRIGGYASPASYALYASSHPDIHAFAFQPGTPATMICGNDGGMQKTTAALAATVAWTTINTGYRTYQYYYVDVDPRSGNTKVIGGAQDNGTTRNIGGSGTSFESVWGGDGVSVGISDPAASGGTQYEYVGSQNGNINRRPSTDPSGFATDIRPATAFSDGLFITLYKLDQDNSNTLYYANDNSFYRTTSASTVASGTWTNMTGIATAVGGANQISAIGLTRGTYSAATASLFLGTSNGKVYRLDDPAGAAAGSAPVDITGAGFPAGAWLSSISANPRNDDTVLVTFSNYGVASTFWTGNANSAVPTWTAVEGNIPLPSYRSSAIALTTSGVSYFVGTSAGLFSVTGLPGFTTWAQEGPTDMGNAVISSLSLRPSDNKLLVGTHGYAMWSAILPAAVSNTITLTSAAGTDAQTVCISTAITPITYSTTGATGATFTGLPAGVTGSWAANVVTISGTPTAAGVFGYTVTLTGGSGTGTATGSITVTANNTVTLTSAAGTNAQTITIGSPITTITYATTGATGATVTGLPAGVTGSWAANVVTISGTPAATGVSSYTVTLTGGCGTITATGTITVNPPTLETWELSAAAGSQASSAPTTTAANITAGILTRGAGVTAAAAGGSISSSGWFNSAAATTLATAIANNEYYEFTLPVNAGFTADVTGLAFYLRSSSTGPNTATLRSSADGYTTDLGTAAAIPNSAASLYSLPLTLTGISGTLTFRLYGWGGASGGGTPSTGGTFRVGTSPTSLADDLDIFGTTAAVSTCSATLTSAAGTNAQTVCISTAITPITYTTVGATGATFTGLPAGVTGSWAANVVTISGTPTAAGVFGYTVTLTGGPCTVETVTGTITVTANNTVTLTSAAGTNAQTVCISTAITSITYATTGATGATVTGLPAGVTGAWAANVVTISGTPTAAGVFSYTVTLTGGCGTVTATGSITVTANNTVSLSSAAGTNAQTVCISTAITSITYATTGATGATVTGLPAGVTGVWAANVVTISGTPTAAGVFGYTVTLTGGCGTVTATGSITVTANNTVTLTSAAGTNAQTITLGSPITTITYATTGATGATVTGLPAGVTGVWAANVVTISGTPTATGLFSYTVTLTGGCGTITATGTITVNPPGNTITLTSAAGTNAQTVCISTAITSITYATTGATGATFSGLPAGVTGVWAANVVTISGTPTAAGVFSYTVTLTGGSGTGTATGSITVTANNTVSLTSAAGTNAQTVCISTAITSITYATTGATGATVTGLPAGVTGVWAANVVTISGTPTAAGVFGYTVTLTGGCGTITATGSITVTANNTMSLTSAAGTNAQTVCISAAITSITYATTGATGATVTGLPAGVTGVWAANVVTISGTPTAAGVFGYTVTLTGGCGTLTATGSITVTANNTVTLTSAAGTNAQTVAISTPITSITYATTGATGATVTGLPAGVTSVWAANVVTISGTPTVAGLFNYTVTLTGGCGTITATGSITVTGVCSAILTSAAGTNLQTVCVSTAIAPITYSTVGATGATFTGLPAGVTGNWAANTITISGTPTASGTFNYSALLTGGGCTTETVTGTINVNPVPDVTQPSNQVVCNNFPTAAVNFTGTVPGTVFNWTNNTTSIGLAASGSGNIASFTALNPGTTPVVATITVTPTTLTPPITQTFNYNGAMQTWTVPAGITSINVDVYGAEGGGNTAVGAAGGAGGRVQATMAVTPGQVLNIFVGGQGDVTGTPGYNGGGSGIGGTLSNPGSGGGGASDIRIGGIALANRIIVAGGGGGGTENGGASIGGTGGGLVGGTGGLGGNPWACSNLTSAKGGTQSAGGLGGTSTDCAWNGSNGTLGVGGDTYLVYRSAGGGGGYYGGGGAHNGHSGGGGSSYTDPSATAVINTQGGHTGNGQVTITYAATSVTCTGPPKTFTITVNPTPAATISYAGSPYCSNAGTATVTRTGTAGGTYSAAPASLTLNAATGDVNLGTSTPGTYTVTYTIAAAGGCPVVTATTSITITQLPAATIVYTGSQYCSNAGTATVTRTGTAGGTYSAAPAGLTLNAATGAVTLATSTAGTYTVTYTIAAAGGCPVVTATATITVTALPAATISYAGTPYCSTDLTAPVTRTGTAGGTYSAAPLGLTINAATGTVTPNTSTPGTYIVTYTIAAAGGCPTVTTTTTITITAAPNMIIFYAGTPYCSNAGTANVTRFGTAGGTYSAAPAGLTINAATGAVTLGTSTPGTYTVTYSVTLPGCGITNTTTTIRITAAPNATISYAGSPYCSNAGTANVTFTGTAGGTYSSTAGLTINAATGAVNLAASTAGTYTVTYTVAASGGCAIYTTTTTITITALPTATIAYTGSPYCSSAGTANVTLTGTAGGTYTAPAGLSINAATGAVNLAASTAGTYTVTYTIAAGGGCPAVTATASITITTLPAATISYAGNPFCQPGAVVPVTRTGTAGGAYSAAPAGLSINAATGDINVTTSTPGTYTVSYTLAAGGGCGAVTATTSVTINSPSTAPTAANATATSLCTPGSVTLSVVGGSLGSGSSWRWYSGTCGGTLVGTGATLNVTVNTTTTYFVRAEGPCNTTTCASVTVTVNVQPTISIAAAPRTTLLPGQTTTLTATVTPAAGNTFIWYRNGVVVPGAGATGSTLLLNVDNLGKYTARVTTAAGCTALSNEVAIIAEISPLVFVYPNPNKGEFEVRVYNPLGKQLTVIVYDIPGQPVYWQKMVTSAPYTKMEVKMRGVADGYYMVTVIDGDNKRIGTKRILIGK